MNVRGMVWLLAAAACNTALPESVLDLTRVEPDTVLSQTESAVEVIGVTFPVVASANFATDDVIQVNDSYRINVGAVPVSDVRRVDDTRLAVVLPQLVAGDYDVEVISPHGNSAILPAALHVIDGEVTTQQCTTGDECTEPCRSYVDCIDSVCVLGPIDRDLDSDTYVDSSCTGGDDCNDADDQVNPGAVELAGNVVDEDCDGSIDCYVDGDGDGHGTDSGATVSDDGDGQCLAATNESLLMDDCDDTCDVCWAGNPEVCGDGADNNCDGVGDEGCTCDYLGSTSGVCAGGGTLDGTGMCTVAPVGYESPEVTCGDGSDNDCDGIEDEGCPCDYLGSTDGVCAGGGTLDGAGTCTIAPVSYESSEATCDDIDNDCSGAPDDGCDDDGDGYCDDTMTVAGSPAICPNSANGPGDDCLDEGGGAAAINPGATELCSGGVDENCNGLTDAVDPACGGDNTPPIAQILVSPGAGFSTDTFTANATGTTDREEAAAALTYEWDWENDAVFEAAGQSVQKSDFAVGEHLVVLKVTDSGGLSGYASFLVIVAPLPDTLLVTTPADDNDAEIYPGPYTNGLSLREAIILANTALSGTAVTVLVPDGYTIPLGSALPESTDPAGLTVVGDGATVDGTAVASAPCVRIASNETRLFGLRFVNCPDGAIMFGGGSGTQVSRCIIEGSGPTLAGSGAVRVTSPGTFGPDNVVTGSPGNGVYITGGAGGTVIQGNRIVGSGQLGLRLLNATVTIRQNVILRNGTGGIDLANNDDNCVVTHNTIHDNTGDGVSASTNSTSLDFRNNILSNNSGAGLNCANNNFATGINDWNAYWGNGSDCSCCGGTLPANSPAEDPVYVDSTPSIDDLRLVPASTLIDAGTDSDVAFDVNGQEPLRWNGTWPDIGSWEAP